jgi:DNA-directed RNA polymerase subunit alpha
MQKREYQPLTIPQVYWDKDSLTQTHGQLVVEPLEPGFGQTFGNALRRVLLGAVEGSAVTAVIIEGVNNEFSVVPGVIEDTVQVVLNIKGIIVKNTTGLPGTMKLRVEGERVATVADIQSDEHLELLNPEHVIAHVSHNGVLDITFFVDSGRGYRPAAWPAGKPLQDDNKMYLDAMFSPVRQVAFDVAKTRVGTSIDYDKLMVDVVTDGTQSPTDVVHYAVSVIRNQFEHFLHATEIPFNALSQAQMIVRARVGDHVAPQHNAPVESPEYKGVPVDLFFKSVMALDFPVRANNCLAAAGIKRVIDLVNKTEDEVLAIKNFGRKSLEEVKEIMQTLGLTFGMQIDEDELRALLQEETAS